MKVVRALCVVGLVYLLSLFALGQVVPVADDKPAGPRVESNETVGVVSPAAGDSPSAATPRVLRFSGSMGEATLNGMMELRFTLYSDAQGGSALWSESHQVQMTNGKYSVVLGTSSADGMPVEVFAGDQARWLGVAQTGQNEMGRSLLVSVPYALKAVEAERLSGKSLAELLSSPEMKQWVADAVAKAQTQAGGADAAASADSANKRLNAQAAMKGGSNGRSSSSNLTTAGTSATFSDTTTIPVVIVTQSGTGEALNVQSGSGVAINAQSTGLTAIQGVATASSGQSFGVIGQSTSTTGRGVRGEATALSGGATVGVQGVSHSTADGSAGLQGFQDAASGVVFGLQGSVASSGGTAIQGTATSTTGSPKGISASVVSKDGIGVYAETTSTTAGNAIGLYVKTNSNGAVGARFETPGTATGALFSGIVGGVQRFHVDNQGRLIVDAAVQGNAIQGNSLYTGSGLTTGVWGETHGPDGVGVLGIAYANSNNTAGVYADGEGTDSVALWGETFGGGASTGLIARTFSGSGTGIGAAIGYAQNPAGAAAGARILSLRNGDPYAGGGSQEVEVAYVDVNGNVHAPSFTGSGAGLTSIPGTAISGNISGTAATATNALALNGKADTAFEQVANKNAASGYAGLDGGSRIAKLQGPAATVYTDAANTWTTGTQDMSGADATLPVKADVSANTPASCVANKEMFIKTDATAGQQLFLCNSGGNGFNLLSGGGGGGSGVDSFNGRTGVVVAASGDYSFSLISGTAAYGQLPVGTTSNTVAAGDDARFTDARNPLAGSSNYIQNAPGSPQAGSMNITGSATVSGLISTANSGLATNITAAGAGSTTGGNGVQGTGGNGTTGSGGIGLVGVGGNSVSGGSGGTGVKGTGGTPGGVGVIGQGTGLGAGISATGGSSSGANGLVATAGPGGIAVQAIGAISGGATTSYGVFATGAGNGPGVTGVGGSTNGVGVVAQGVGTSAGINAFGGASGGAGITSVGGSSSGVGIIGTGGTSNGLGIRGVGSGTGAGGSFLSSGSNANAALLVRNKDDNATVFSITGTGAVTASSSITATSFSGDGSALTNVGSATAVALAANGTNCAAGQFAAGVDAGGNAEGCSSNGSSLTSLNASNISSGVLGITQGGTGSGTQNFVDLSTTQTVAGAKSFSNLVAANAGISVGSGAAILKHLSATASLDFAAWAGNDCQDLTVTVTGAADGDTVALGIPNALASFSGVSWSGFVSSANTVTVRGCKVSSGASTDPGAATVRVDVWQH